MSGAGIRTFEQEITEETENGIVGRKEAQKAQEKELAFTPWALFCGPFARIFWAA